MKVINKQYDNVCLESSNKLKINSVVLIRNITNETKREPLKLARIEEIKKSRDDAQRVVVVTYHNVNINNKSGLFKATLVFSVFKLGQIPSPAFIQLYNSSKIGLLLCHSHIELRLS